MVLTVKIAANLVIMSYQPKEFTIAVIARRLFTAANKKQPINQQTNRLTQRRT